MKIKNIYLEKGQSLFELVVAISISALIVTGIVAFTSNAIQNSSYSRDKTLASIYVQEAIEWLRKENDQNRGVFEAKALYDRGLDVSYCLNGLSWPAFSGSCSAGSFIGGNTRFTRTLTFLSCNPCDPEMVELNVTVSWEDSKGAHEVSSTTNLSIK